jgi:hypothetical protein
VTNLSRFPVFHLAAFSVLCVLPAICVAEQRAPIAEEIGEVYGVKSFRRVEAIRYTFNIPELKLSRSWVWQPKTDTVTYDGPDKAGKPMKVTYRRDQLSSQSDTIKNDIDPAFINDHYVLLFPLHLAWDDWAAVSDEGVHEMPISQKATRRVLVKYPPRGGYSPGDTWELYIGENKRLEEFIYHRAGAGFPKVYTGTWEGYETAGPLLLSTDHEGTTDDGKPLRVFYSNVAVKVTGSHNWVSAH